MTRDKRNSLIVYSLALLFLAAFLVGTMLLPRWQEKQRQQKIDTLTTQARQVSGMTLLAAEQKFSTTATALAVLFTEHSARQCVGH